MKKVVSLLLTALLLLTMMATAATTVAAEEKTMILYEMPNEVVANQKDGTKDGWRNSKVDAGKPGLEVLDLDGEIGLGFAFSGTETNFFNTIRFLFYTTTPYDLTDIMYVEFDLYISDASMYSASENSIMIELCSSGRQDSYEISTDIRPDLEEGWNHIRIQYSSFKPGSPNEIFDQTAWNFFRLCINGPYNTGSDKLTVAIANLTFWNGLNEDGLTEEEAARQEMLEKIGPTLDKINELKDIKSQDDMNAENHESVKKIIAEAYELYNALGEDEKGAVSEEGGLRILKTAERAVKGYEEYLAELEEQKPECTEHVDEENDGKCDVCGAEVPKHDPEEDDKPGEDISQTPGENEKPDGEKPQEPEKKGCKGAISVGAVAVMTLAGAWVTVIARKKCD